MSANVEIVEGKVCSVQVLTAVDGRFFAHVQCGSTLKVTDRTYKEYTQAENAGRQLLADTLAELEDDDA